MVGINDNVMIWKDDNKMCLDSEKQYSYLYLLIKKHTETSSHFYFQ